MCLFASPLETGFKPRDPTEVVRNCSRVNWEVKKVIVDTLTRQLLQTENYIIVYRFQDGHTSSKVAESSCSLSYKASPSVSVQQHTANAQRQQQGEEWGSLSGPSERGKLSHSNGTKLELKSQWCNDECMRGGAEQEKLKQEVEDKCVCKGDGGHTMCSWELLRRAGGEEHGMKTGVALAYGCCSSSCSPAGATVEESHINSEMVKWNLGGMCVYMCVCVCVCVCVCACMCVCMCVC